LDPVGSGEGAAVPDMTNLDLPSCSDDYAFPNGLLGFP